MKSALIAIIALALLSTLSCTTLPEYGHGSVGTDTALIPAPFRGGGAEEVGETLAGVQIGLGALYNSNDFNGLARAFIQRGDNLGWFAFTYGASGFGGLYTVTSGTRSYYGGSLHGSAMFLIPFEAVEIRLLGFQAAVTYENGEFHDFRQNAAGISNIAPDPLLVGFGGFTEVCVKLGEEARLGIRVGVGGTQSDFRSGNDPDPTASLGAYFTFSPVTVWLQMENVVMLSHSPALVAGVAYRLF